MIHKPCGIHNPKAPCMVDGKCKRKFPQKFCEETVMDDNGFTRPKRPDNGRTFKMKVNGKEVDVDNRWVYFMSLNTCLKVMIKAFVEMNEFIDNEMVQALNYDEIKSYEDYRYISATEAHWHLSDFGCIV
uniref:Uncharacterized protein n=1 Tax=Panagrolaimus superbus TaxID=310955 RepID=A0A914ZAY8_9BILA